MRQATARICSTGGRLSEASQRHAARELSYVGGRCGQEVVLAGLNREALYDNGAVVIDGG